MLDTINSGSVSSSDINVLIGILTLLVSFLTFWLAWKVSKTVFRNQAKSKQVDSVSKLLKFLNNTKINLEFTNFYETGSGHTSYDIFYNIFEIGSLLEQNEIDEDTYNGIRYYDDALVLLDDESDQIFDCIEYIDDSFIPRDIADILVNFHTSRCTTIKYADLIGGEESKVVVLNTTQSEKRNMTFKQTDCEACKSWLNLMTHASNLTEEIKKWYKKNGIKDINIRVDFKNKRNFDTGQLSK